MAGTVRKRKSKKPAPAKAPSAAWQATQAKGVITPEMEKEFGYHDYRKWKDSQKKVKAKRRKERPDSRGAYNPDSTGMFRGK